MLSELREWLVFNAQRQRIKRQFKRSVGIVGDFENPASYQEKLQFRKLYGNHEFYALVADKYRARDYVASKVGEDYLVPLLGAYDKLDPSIFAGLPHQFIIKANHGCKWHAIVRDKSRLDIGKTVRRFNTLQRRRYGWIAGERHYNFIPPKIVIEQLLPGPSSGCPWDYNFFCYNGPGGFDYTFAIATPQGKVASYAKDWTLRANDIPEDELTAHGKPENFDEMVRVAKDLSADFDFVRVDLYSVAGKVYFGELTCTPHQGYFRIEDPEQQRMRDDLWHLDAGQPAAVRAAKIASDQVRTQSRPSHKVGTRHNRSRLAKLPALSRISDGTPIVP